MTNNLHDEQSLCCTCCAVSGLYHPYHQNRQITLSLYVNFNRPMAMKPTCWVTRLFWPARPTNTKKSHVDSLFCWINHHMTWNQKFIDCNKYPSGLCLYLLRTACSISYIGQRFVTYSLFSNVKSDRTLPLKRPIFDLAYTFHLHMTPWITMDLQISSSLKYQGHHINQSALFNQTQTCLGNMGFDSKSLRRMGWFPGKMAQGNRVDGEFGTTSPLGIWAGTWAPRNSTHTNPTVKELALWSGGYYSWGFLCLSSPDHNWPVTLNFPWHTSFSVLYSSLVHLQESTDRSTL